MQAQRVGIREFRERLASFLDRADPIAITRHGETVGFFIPARPRPKPVDLEPLRAAATVLDEQITAAGVSEDELLREFQASRRSRKARS